MIHQLFIHTNSLVFYFVETKEGKELSPVNIISVKGPYCYA